MEQWILISMLAMSLALVMIIALLCLLYMNGDDKREEKFEEWKKSIENKIDKVKEDKDS